MTLGRILLLLALLAAALVQALAAPLDADSCAKLMNEHGQLEQAGVEADMAKGPEWGKANLLPEKLDRIRRFIEIEQQLLFRCRQKSLVTLPPEVEAAPGSEDKDKDKSKDQDKDKNAAAPPTADKAKAPPAAAKKGTGPAKKAVQPAAKPASKQPKQGPGPTKPPAKAKAAAKQPAGAKSEPAPSTATEKRAPKAKAEED